MSQADNFGCLVLETNNLKLKKAVSSPVNVKMYVRCTVVTTYGVVLIAQSWTFVVCVITAWVCLASCEVPAHHVIFVLQPEQSCDTIRVESEH